MHLIELYFRAMLLSAIHTESGSCSVELHGKEEWLARL
jgi:hypothetical protein